MNSPLLGLDIGLKRTGVALSESGLIAEPLTTIEWHPPHSAVLIQKIIELVRAHNIRSIVVGVPYGEHDEVTAQSQKTLHLIQHLEAALVGVTPPVEVITTNEYLSTQDGLKQYSGVDKDAAAAAVILQSYLESVGAAW